MGAVLFVREDWLLKASHYKTITVPGHVHSGKWIEPFQKKVLVSDDHNDLNVAAGYGSFYQKQAHKKLSAELDHFHTMHPQDKAAIILHHATDMQAAASASAAVSGFKASMLAGKTPTTSQYLAMKDAPSSVQSKVADACAAAIGDEKYMQLLFAASAKANQTKGKPDESKTSQAISKKTEREKTQAGLTHSVGLEAITSKNVSDGGWAGVKMLTDAASALSQNKQGLDGIDADTMASVKSLMLGIGHNNKILQSVVELIPVDVVNMLASKQLTPEMLFHDPSMLQHDGVWGDGDGPVSVLVNVAASVISAMAVVAAKNPAFFELSHSGGLPVAKFPTNNAGEKIPVGGLGPSIGGASKFTGADGAAANGSDVFDLGSVAGEGVPAEITIDGKHVVTPNSDGVLGVDGGGTPSTPTTVSKHSDEVNLPPKIKAKLDDWATDGYVDRLQDVVDDHGSSPAYSAYAKKLLEQFKPPADDGAVTLKDWPGTKYKLNASGNWESNTDGYVAEVYGPELQSALFIKKRMPVPADVVAKLSDKSKAAIVKDAAAEFGMSPMDVQKLLTANEKPAPVEAKDQPIKIQYSSTGVPLKPDAPAFKGTMLNIENYIADENLSDLKEAVSDLSGLSSASAKTAQAYAEAGIRYLEKKAKAGPKEGDTKTENGKEYELHNGKWHRVGQFGPMSPMSFGAAAHAAGIKSPMQDPDFVAVHGTDESSNSLIQAMSGWHKGWDKEANLAAALVAKPSTGSSGNSAATVADDTDNHKAAVAAMETGAFYQKEAIKKLKAEHGDAWAAMHPSKQHELAHAKYQALQGAASQAAAVSGWKKHMLAGQVPTPSEVKAMTAFDAATPDKAVKVMNDVQAVIGLDKYIQLVTQANAKAAKAPVAQPAKVFVTEKPAAAAPSLSGSSVDKVLADADDKGGKAAVEEQAKNWLAANQGKEGLLNNALYGMGYSSLAVKTTSSAAPAGPVPVTSNVYTNTTEGHKKFWSVSVHGNKMKTTYGKLGTQGSETTKEFSSPAAAVAAANKLKGEKVAKGYTYGYTGVHQYAGAVAVPVKQTLAQAVADSGSLSGATAVIKDHLAQAGETEQAFDDAREAALSQGHKSLAQAIKTKKEAKFPVNQVAAAPVQNGISAFQFDPKDAAFSDSATLTTEADDGSILYVAHDGEKYQVGVVGVDAESGSHDDFPYPEDAAAQIAILAKDHGVKAKLPTSSEIEKLNQAAGPKDGDTKQGADGTLVFKDGRWHKQGVVIPDFNAISPGKWGPIYNDVAKALKEAVDAGGLAALKKHVTYHKDGRISITVTKLNTKLNKLAENPLAGAPMQKARHAAMHKLVMDLTAAAKALPKGKKVVFTTGSPTTPSSAAAKPAAAAPAPKAKPTMTATLVKTAPGKPPVTVIDGWQQTGPQKGSNPGGKFKDKAGQEWYCKFPADIDVAMNELLAAKFYQMLGVAVPNLKLVEQGGKVGIASKWVDGISKGTSAQLAKAPGAHQAFALDAWLANWDVVGLSNDNLMLGKDGAAVRVDVGGSLVYRAQGGAKGDAFGDDVPELETLRDAKTNDKSAAVFGGVKGSDMAWGLGQLNKLKPSQIEELCQKAGPGSDADKAALAKKLIARRAFILKKYGIDDQWAAVTALDPTKLPVDPANMPTPFDFVNFHGAGKGLSSSDKVNQQNTIDSKALFEFALKGNLTALQNYQYEAFDKATGKSLGMKPISAHPASKIQGQWSDLCQMLTSISHPPVYGLDLPPFGGGSVDEVSDAAGYFMPGETTSTISPEKVVGFWMKLGHVGKDAVADLAPSKISYYKTSFEAKAKSWYKACSHPVQTLISMIQGGSSGNRIWSNGTKSAAGLPLNQLAKKVYEEAVEHDEGTTIHRWMKMDQGMINKLMSEGAGLVFQNTDSMCASIFKDWGDHSHFGNGAFLKIRYAKGAKALDTYGSGSFRGSGKDAEGHHLYKDANGNQGGEMEVTTLMGARFVVLDIKKGNASSSTGITMELLMLPPSEGYLAEVGKLASLGKSVVLFFTKMLKKAA